MAIVTRQMADGRTLEVRVSADGNWVEPWVDGVQDGGAAGIGSLNQPQPPYTHYVRGSLHCYGITSDDADKIRVAQIAARAAYVPSLTEQRARLVANVTGAIADAKDAREAAYNDDTRAIPSYSTPQVQAARVALDAFDREHPEVIAALKREQAASVERHLWD